MKSTTKKVIISLYLVIRLPLKFYILFIKNKEIRENWGKSIMIVRTLEPMACEAGWSSGKGPGKGVGSQVMPLIGWGILRKPVFLFGADDRPP